MFSPLLRTFKKGSSLSEGMPFHEPNASASSSSSLRFSVVDGESGRFPVRIKSIQLRLMPLPTVSTRKICSSPAGIVISVRVVEAQAFGAPVSGMSKVASSLPSMSNLRFPGLDSPAAVLTVME